MFDCGFMSRPGHSSGSMAFVGAVKTEEVFVSERGDGVTVGVLHNLQSGRHQDSSNIEEREREKEAGYVSILLGILDGKRPSNPASDTSSDDDHSESYS